LVSVAVVTYNQKSFLRECLDSILAQNYPNIEIAVADDGSTDGTREMLHEYASKHPDRFVLRFAEQNRGITANQNLALSACTGKYISWMAGDDLMLPGKIDKQVAFLEAHPEHSICYHDLDVFDSATGKTIKRHSDVDRPRCGDVRTLIRFGAFNGAVSNMVRASSQPAHGFDERIPVASDWLYWVECLWSGGKIGYINEVLGRHRRHENNVTAGSLKKPWLRGVVDHLMSCDIVLAKAPQFVSDVNARKASHLLSLRWMNDGENYARYLRASLSYRWSWKVQAALLANALFGIRR
jgi:glycosyltransferase involved in cell wall biosynthesis